MNTKKFIKTNDEKTRQYLIDNGYTLLNKEGSYWVFVNLGKTLDFADYNLKYIVTDYLYV